MPKLSWAIPHALDPEEAARELKQGFSSLKDTYSQHVSDLEEVWNDNTLTFSFKTFGFGIKGTVTVEQPEVKIAAEIPLAAMVFKGAIEQQVGEKIRSLLE